VCSPLQSYKAALMGPSRPTSRAAFRLVLALGLFLPTSAQAQKMYFTAYDKIFCANLDGTDIECLLDFLTTGSLCQPWGIALDTDHGKMYWTDYLTKKVRRANLDGSSMEDLAIACRDNPTGIALDVPGGRVYWGEKIFKSEHEPFGGTINRANLDGSAAELLLEGYDVNAIALDLDAGKVYWAGGAVVGRANLDGSMIECLIETPDVERTGLALDPAEEKMYLTAGSRHSHYAGRAADGSLTWTTLALRPAEGSTDCASIQEAKIDREPVPLTVSEIYTLALISRFLPGSVALDIPDRRAYWTWNQPGMPHGTITCDVGIQRAKLDGSEVEDVVYCQGIELMGGAVNSITLDLRAREHGARAERLRVLWIAGLASFLAVLGAVLVRRLRNQRRPAAGPQAQTAQGRKRSGPRRALKRSCACVSVLVIALWLVSTFVATGFEGFSSAIGLSHGEVCLGTQKQPPPGYMKGRLVRWPVQPGFIWLNWGWKQSLWSKAISKPSWGNWSWLLGLTLPRRESDPGSRRVIMPLWLPFSLLFPTTVFFYWRDRRRRPPGHCRNCGYDLTGNVSGVCPECGTVIAGGNEAGVA